VVVVKVMKTGSLNLLGISRPDQASTGIILLAPFTAEMAFGSFYSKSREVIWAAYRTFALISAILFVSIPVNRDFTCVLYFEI
jgi:hypothetical protein